MIIHSYSTFTEGNNTGTSLRENLFSAYKALKRIEYAGRALKLSFGTSTFLGVRVKCERDQWFGEVQKSSM
jgi:hypothetical protein